MKLFDVDWATVLGDLHRWGAFTTAARRTVLDELKMNGYVPEVRFGPHLPALAASGLAIVEMDRHRVSLAPPRRDVVKVLRAMGRHPVFDAPTPDALAPYIAEHLTQLEIDALGASDAAGGFRLVNCYLLAQRVASSGWPGDLLEAGGDQGLAGWARSHGVRADAGTIANLRTLQQLARKLVDTPTGVPLADLISEWGAKGLRSHAGALHLGLSTLVLFAGMRRSDLEPLIGLWPAAAIELKRPRAHAPTTVVPVEQFALPVRMEDMTALLSTVVAAPVRVRSDTLSVFARSRTDIEKRMVGVPPWAASYFGAAEFSRVDLAARELEMLGFVEIRPRQGNPHLGPTPAGKRWLALPAQGRLAALLDPMRKSKDANPPGAYESAKTGRFFPFALPYFEVPASLNIRRDLTRAFLSASDGFLPLEPFLDYHMREANPFLELHKTDPVGQLRVLQLGARDPRESYRVLWKNMLLQFLATQLIALGGARIGRMSTGTFCFSITDIGRYLLGAGSAFAYGTAESSDIVVQPNFDIVFLGAAPSLEAEIARFAERAGVAPGLAFRITRASVLRAAESGVTAADVTGTLSRVSSKPIPANVQREITGWMASVRRARLRTVEVLECADEDTAHRVSAVLGRKAQPLTSTMFELSTPTPSARAALLKRLRAEGVFVDQRSDPDAPQARKKRSRRPEVEVDAVTMWDDDDDEELWDEPE